MADNSFLGKGWSFPPHFDIKTGSVEMVSGEEDIRQSLQIILSTKLGERFLVPEFGCNLDNYQFKSMTNTLRLHIKSLISDAISVNEPRVILNDVIMHPDDALDGKLLIDVQYTIKSTNSRKNLVFPYLLG